MCYVNQYSDTCLVTATVADPLRTAKPENRRFGRRTTGGTACTQQKAEGTAAPSASYCILYLRRALSPGRPRGGRGHPRARYGAAHARPHGRHDAALFLPDDRPAAARAPPRAARGAFRRQGMHAGYTAASKKAIVTLTKDSKEIEFFNSMV